MLEGLAMIFVVFIIIMAVVFEKKEYGNLWVKLETIALIFMMAVAPYSSVFAIRNGLPMKVAWIFHFFTLADIIIAIIYFSKKITEIKKHPSTELVICPKCLNFSNLPIPVKPDEHCPCCQTPYFHTGAFKKSTLFSNKDNELRIWRETFSKTCAEFKAGPDYDPKAEAWQHEATAVNLRNWGLSTYKNYRPKCPTCGSTLLYKIDLSGKEIGSMSEGFIDRKLGETYRCDSCGYKW